MKFPWFKRTGLFFIPVSLIGWLILTAALCYAVYNFIELNNRDHSVSDFLINFLFILLIIGAVYSLVAYLTSRTNKA